MVNVDSALKISCSKMKNWKKLLFKIAVVIVIIIVAFTG
jgi:t-SNARE complex subunit (syntaxin)